MKLHPRHTRDHFRTHFVCSFSVLYFSFPNFGAADYGAACSLSGVDPLACVSDSVGMDTDAFFEWNLCSFRADTRFSSVTKDWPQKALPPSYQYQFRVTESEIETSRTLYTLRRICRVSRS